MLMHEAHLPSNHPLYRPRHGRQRFAGICAAIFFFAPIIGLGLSGRPAQIENRPLHEFPSLSQGWDFFTQLGPWATDWLPMRDAAVRTEDGISRSVFGESPQLGGRGGDQPTVSVPGSGPPEGQTNGIYPQVIEGTDGWLYIGNDTYAKCNPIIPTNVALDELAGFKKVVEASGRKFVLVVPPDKSDIYPEHLPEQYVGKDCAPVAAAQFWKLLGSTVGSLDLRPDLLTEAKNLGRPIYFKQDTHWLFQGGLIMVRKVAENLKPGVTATWKVSDKTSFAWPNDLPPLLGKRTTQQAELQALAPDGGADRTQYFFGRSNTDPIVLHSTPTTGTVTQKVGMIADSYTGLANMYFAATFNNMTIMHTDFVQQQTAAAAQKLVDSDVVVLEVAERLLAGGTSTILTPGILTTLSQELVKHPLR